jgi:hypothetical protein
MWLKVPAAATPTFGQHLAMSGNGLMIAIMEANLGEPTTTERLKTARLGSNWTAAVMWFVEGSGITILHFCGLPTGVPFRLITAIIFLAFVLPEALRIDRRSERELSRSSKNFILRMNTDRGPRSAKNWPRCPALSASRLREAGMISSMATIDHWLIPFQLLPFIRCARSRRQGVFSDDMWPPILWLLASFLRRMSVIVMRRLDEAHYRPSEAHALIEGKAAMKPGWVPGCRGKWRTFIEQRPFRYRYKSGNRVAGVSARKRVLMPNLFYSYRNKPSKECPHRKAYDDG